MGKIKSLLFLVVFFICGNFCFAKQISFQLIQHDSDRKDVTEEAFVIEENLFNSFFDLGLIVTNSPAELSDSNEKDKVLFESGMKDAVDGASDYYAQIVLNFKNNGKKRFIENVEWSVYSVSDGKKIKSGKIKYKKESNSNEIINDIGDSVVMEIKKAIKA